jgi:hypothetical protein
MGMSNLISGGKDVYSYALASWAFFNGLDRHHCVDGNYTCQKYMHYVLETPEDLNIFGLCSKDAEVTLRMVDEKEVVTKDGFTGSWPNGGGDVGRYTTQGMIWEAFCALRYAYLMS